MRRSSPASQKGLFYSATAPLHERGFTLVELAISLTVIGLLIGGVLKGRELVENASATRVIRQVQAYKAATTSFKDGYGALPGDIRDPAMRLPGCGAPLCNIPGDGNGIVGVEITSPFTATATGFGEPRRYWLHLAVAQMITGIDSSGPDVSGPCGSNCGDFGISYPEAIEGGGFFVVNQNVAPFGNYPQTKGHYFWMTANPGQLLGYISSHMAAMIDRKSDDGLPFSGDVLGADFTASSCISGTDYKESGSEKQCGMVFFAF